MAKNRWFWIVALAGIAADQLTKYWTILSFDSVGDTYPLWEGVFHFTYVLNTGAAFSLFQGTGNWLRWLSLAVSLGLMGFAWLGPAMGILDQLGYGLILAGAIGNGLDRLLFGYVVDFLDFRAIRFPVFNVADICINLGIGFVLLASLRGGPTATDDLPSQQDRR